MLHSTNNELRIPVKSKSLTFATVSMKNVVNNEYIGFRYRGIFLRS